MAEPEQENPQHFPGQEEAVPQPDESKQPEEIPAEGNNIASVADRAHADTGDPSHQVVEKTFVPPPDEHTVNP